MNTTNGTGMGQFMVDQTPKFDSQIPKKKRKKNGYQVMGKLLIRPDKRRKAKYL